MYCMAVTSVESEKEANPRDYARWIELDILRNNWRNIKVTFVEETKEKDSFEMPCKVYDFPLCIFLVEHNVVIFLID